jgi:hypothetical protein
VDYKRHLVGRVADAGRSQRRGTLKMVGKDVGAVTIGLFVSLVIAISVNDHFRDAVKGMLGLGV